MKLLPSQDIFFALFQEQAGLIVEASRLLLNATRSGNSQLAIAAKEINALEKRGDEIIHDILKRLNQTFITPFDPEDIHVLSSRLDDVLDYIEDAAFRLAAYRVDPVPNVAVQLAQTVDLCCGALAKAIASLSKHQDLIADCIEINRLENEADSALRTAVGDLFATEKDPISLIKHKEIYEMLEATTDRCEDVADALQNLMVKNS